MMKSIKIILGLLIIQSSLFGQAGESNDYKDQLFEVTKVMVHDVVNPPASARYYAYCTLGSYLALGNSAPVSSQSLLSSLNEFDLRQIPQPVDFNPDFAAGYALLEVGKNLLPSGEKLEPIQEDFISEKKKEWKLNKKQIDAHISYSETIAQWVVDYSKTDGYSKLSTYVGYTPKQGDGYWYPTPPAYIEAIEPNWSRVRPFFLDSATQFAPASPTPFDMDPESPFYKRQLMGVYEAVKNRSQEEEAIAKFWDCNPFEVKFHGHMMIGMKKITPGGHWMGIAGIACEKANLDLAETVAVHAMLGLTLHDAFVSCWDEKYRSERIRPETVINQHLDKNWRPVLQTPPFPEYTSGHSVASAASAILLTQIFGESFSFIDDTEVYFGLPKRPFESFNAAAEEAAISRLYGGIHYIDACELGVDQGRSIGQFIVNKLF